MQAVLVADDGEGCKLNRYDRYPGDYMRDTIDLSMLEDGAYTRLLDVYYANERPIDDAAKFRISRAMDDAEREATQRVLDRFFRPITDGSKKAWVHDRVEREIEKARPRIEAAKRNGRLGGRPPKQPDKPIGFSDGSALGNPPSNPEANPTKNPEETQVESSPSPPPSPSVTNPSPTPSGKPKRQRTAWPSRSEPFAPPFSEIAEAMGFEAEDARKLFVEFQDYWHREGNKRTYWDRTWRKRLEQIRKSRERRGNAANGRAVPPRQPDNPNVNIHDWGEVS